MHSILVNVSRSALPPSSPITVVQCSCSLHCIFCLSFVVAAAVVARTALVHTQSPLSPLQKACAAGESVAAAVVVVCVLSVVYLPLFLSV